VTELTSTQESAYNSIQSRLEEGFLNDVNEADLSSIRETLQGLSATDADAVIDEMARNGELQRLADESNDSEFLGMGQDGFSADDQRALFADLAGKLDGDSLAKIHDAYVQAESGQTEFDRVTELADAIATHGTSTSKLDYINAIKEGAGDGSIDSVNIAGGSSSYNVDGEAAAIGTVLGSLRGSYAAEGFEALSSEQLDAVLRTGIGETVNYGHASVSSSYDVGRFQDVMAAAASTSDPSLKADVFAAGAEHLRTIRDADTFPAISLNEDELRGASESMANLIDSDTTGIVTELAYDGTTRDGSAMSAYTQVMIETGQTERLSDQMLDLQFGNDRNENAVDRLDEVTTLSNGQERRENAGALGYFVGSVYAGAKAHSSNVEDQQKVISGFLNFAVGKIPSVGGVSASDAMLGQDLISKAVEAAIDNPGMDPAQRLEMAALPLDANNDLAVGDAIFSAFEDTLSTVERLAKP
jgi:hypothetical protein